MPMIDNIKQLLLTEYGISTEKELDRAISMMVKPDIGVFAGDKNLKEREQQE